MSHSGRGLTIMLVLKMALVSPTVLKYKPFKHKKCPYVPRTLMISAKLTIHLSETTTQSFPVFSLIYDASKDILLLFIGLTKAMND